MTERESKKQLFQEIFKHILKYKLSPKAIIWLLCELDGEVAQIYRRIKEYEQLRSGIFYGERQVLENLKISIASEFGKNSEGLPK